MYTCTLGWIHLILTFLDDFRLCCWYRLSEFIVRDCLCRRTRAPFIINVHLVAWNWGCQLAIGIAWQPSCEQEALETHMTVMNLISSSLASSGACMPRPSPAATFCSSYWVTLHPTCSAISLAFTLVFTHMLQIWNFTINSKPDRIMTIHIAPMPDESVSLFLVC